MLTLALALTVAQSSRPNIVFIFTDDHARQAISAYGSRLMQTPAIDRLAREGVRFDRHYTTNPLCAPSRATILTGKFSHLNGHKDNSQSFNGAQETFPKLLQAAGYETAWIGKWHLQSNPTGFSHWEILPGQGNYYNPDFITPAGTHREEGYATELITEKAKSWIKEQGRKPFFLMIGHKAPHRNWVPSLSKIDLFKDQRFAPPADLRRDYRELNSGAAKAKMRIADHLSMDGDLLIDKAPPRITAEQRSVWDVKMKPQDAEIRRRLAAGESKTDVIYDRYIKNYLRCVSSVDDSISEVLKTLQELRLDKNTIVIYSSDQGFFLGEFGWYDKRWFYEPSSGTPLIVRWPGVKPGVVDSLTSNIDLAPTILDAAGVRTPKEMQGTSLRNLIKTKKADPNQVVYGHFYESDDSDHQAPKYVSVMRGSMKLIYYYELDEWELFDIKTDSGEHHNLWNAPNNQDKRMEWANLLLATQKRYAEDPQLIKRIGAKVSKLLYHRS